jgi:invasion protein IalB
MAQRSRRRFAIGPVSLLVAAAGAAGAYVLITGHDPGSAVAQDTADTPLVEAFDDWTLRCAPPTEGSDGAPACAVTLQMTGTDADGQSVTILVVSVAPVAGTAGAMVTVVTPLGADLRRGVTVTVASSSAVAPFLTCDAGGCLVRQSVDESVIQALRDDAGLKIDVPMATGQVLGADLSLTGFDAAWARLTSI